MTDQNILFLVFSSGLMFPVIIYHLFLLLKTGDKIHYNMVITVIGFILFEMFFSNIPDAVFRNSKILYFLPIFELGTIMVMIYSLNLKIEAENKKNKYSILKIYSALTGIIAVIFFIFITTRGNAYFDVTEKVSISLPALLILVSFLIPASYKIAKSQQTNTIDKLSFMIFFSFTLLQTIGHMAALSSLKYFFYHLPVVLYLSSINAINPHIVNLKDNHEENDDNTAEIIITKKESDTVKEEVTAKDSQVLKEETEISADIDFSSFLKRKINIYNELKDTFTRVTKAVKDGIILNAKKSDAENFIHSVFSFVRNNGDPENELYITLLSDDKYAYLNIGDFRMDTNDRSLNMDKVRLTDIRNNCTTLGGTITIGKNIERNTIYLRIKIPFKTITPIETASSKENTNNLRVVFLITDSDETASYIDKIIKDKFFVIHYSSEEDAVNALVNTQVPDAILSAMSNDADNQEVYYSLERMKEFSNIPLVIIGNEKKPQYLELKSYRLIPALYMARPIEQSLLMEKLEYTYKTTRDHKERNIGKIQTKIEKTDNDKEGDFSKRFDDKCQYFGFNEKEKMIILYLLKGVEYNNICTKTGIKTDDLLKIIDMIFNKTGTTSRIELIDVFVR